jgi:peptidyl-prolyl cis-trans isomerase A (cyclophilin A)
MLARLLLLVLCSTLASASPAQTAASPVPQAEPPNSAPASQATVRVVLQTAAGAITLELEAERAPLTTTNFLRYVDQKRLDGATFYRATEVGGGLGLVQGGVRSDPKRSFPPVAHEPTTKTGLSHVDGAISMARHAPGSATGDFFIMVGASPSMDADPSQPGDNLGFAVFGRVVDGMDVVRQILTSPKSPTEGEGVMKGQMLAAPVRILSARRQARP